MAFFTFLGLEPGCSRHRLSESFMKYTGRCLFTVVSGCKPWRRGNNSRDTCRLSWSSYVSSSSSSCLGRTTEELGSPSCADEEPFQPSWISRCARPLRLLRNIQLSHTETVYSARRAGVRVECARPWVVRCRIDSSSWRSGRWEGRSQ